MRSQSPAEYDPPLYFPEGGITSGLSDCHIDLLLLSGLKVGDRAVYSCEPGHGVVGEEDRTCGQDGKWSGPDPYCKQQGEWSLLGHFIHLSSDINNSATISQYRVRVLSCLKPCSTFYIFKMFPFFGYMDFVAYLDVL